VDFVILSRSVGASKWLLLRAEANVVFVGNMPWSITEEELHVAFGKCGEIVEIRIQEDRDGRRRGFGFIEFSTQEAAKTAMDMNGVIVGGRELRVDITTRNGQPSPPFCVPLLLPAHVCSFMFANHPSDAAVSAFAVFDPW
jgi:RNA recognition motif-containing protein